MKEAPRSTPLANPGAGRQAYDLLVKGGRIIDPSQEMDRKCDLAIRDGEVALIASDIPSADARRVINASGKLVTPGLIDVHTHVFPYVGPYGIEPDSYCVKRAVTTAVDAGTSGAFTFPALRRFVASGCRTRIRALLNVVAIGMVAGSTPSMGELEDLRYCDPDLAARVARENRDLIVGLKIRFSKQYTGPNDLEGMIRARAAADAAELPLMIHIGDSFTPLKPLFALLRKGDIVTHCFTALAHNILDDHGILAPEVIEARQRGIRFDVGHGAGSFSFDVLERCVDQGFLPDTISTDLYSANVHGPVFDLLTTLSKHLRAGMSLSDVIARCTSSAAAMFKFGVDIGTLRPMARADVSVIELEQRNVTLMDSFGNTRDANVRLTPVVTIRGGRLFFPNGAVGEEEAR